MARKVKCLYCEEYFDKEKEEHVKVGNRYAHQECSQVHLLQKAQEQRDKQVLDDYIIKLYGQILPFHRKQIKELLAMGFTHASIYKTLFYFYDVKGNSKDKSKGLGIAPYVAGEAKDYYIRKEQIEKQAQGMQKVNSTDRVVRIHSPKVVRRVRVVDLDVLEGEIMNDAE